MTEVVSWEETPAALLRNRGLTVRKDIADLAAEVASPDRAEAHRAFRESWAPVLTVQEALAKRGWPGAFITVPRPLVPPELAPLYAAQAASQTRHGMRTPAGDDPVLAEMVAAERERFAAAQAAHNRVLGPLANTVG